MPYFVSPIANGIGTIVTAIGIIFSASQGFTMEPKITVALAGDSTVADWSKEKPARGWGQALAPLLTENVRVINLAVCGASTKTFPGTGNWKRALDARPDFIFIQFGHNDSHSPDKPESTKADTEYAANLERFVSEARAAGISPLLVTPVHRRMFDPQGEPTKELGPYAEAMRSVAQKNQVPLIDLYESSGELLSRLGEAGSGSLTVSDLDRTHFTEEGAGVMAGLVVAGMRKASPDLARLVRENPSTP